MITIKGDLILEKDTEYNESLTVEGKIICKLERFSLKVCGNINAWNINARNIDAWNIDASNIVYYAVCFAYNCINCLSIKGRRENCKHFCLDGEIKIKEDVPEYIEQNGRKYKLVGDENE